MTTALVVGVAGQPGRRWSRRLFGSGRCSPRCTTPQGRRRVLVDLCSAWSSVLQLPGQPFGAPVIVRYLRPVPPPVVVIRLWKEPWGVSPALPVAPEGTRGRPVEVATRITGGFHGRGLARTVPVVVPEPPQRLGERKLWTGHEKPD